MFLYSTLTTYDSQLVHSVIVTVWALWVFIWFRFTVRAVVRVMVRFRVVCKAQKVAIQNVVYVLLCTYCVPVWVPYKNGDIEVLEKVQKKATKIIPEISQLPYSERLKACKLPTLHFR